MQIDISFPGGARVDASFDSQSVRTDQPPSGGGQGSAATPFATFLASIGTCAGIYVLGFCRQRGLPTEGLHLTQTMKVDSATGLISDIRIDIHAPEGFPEKYLGALVRAAEQCTVKKHLEHPPRFEVTSQMDPRPGKMPPIAA
jgi:ribosomal protein S12 methylthiotransferase accessory factor